MENKYFANMRRQANEMFMSADGFADADGYDDYSEFGGQEQLGADAVVKKPVIMSGKPEDSNPYIVTIVCGTADVSSVEVLNANVRQNNSTTTGVTYSFSATGITYNTFLASISAGEVFECGLTRLIASNSSTSTAQQQIVTPITITTRTLSGRAIQDTIYPSLPGTQYISTQVDIPNTYLVNGLTSFILGTVYANTTLTIRFYPARRINQFTQLDKGIGVTAYKNPKVNSIV